MFPYVSKLKSGKIKKIIASRLSQNSQIFFQCLRPPLCLLPCSCQEARSSTPHWGVLCCDSEQFASSYGQESLRWPFAKSHSRFFLPLFSPLVLKHGEYPRLSINKETAKKIQNSEIRNKVLAQSKTRIPSTTSSLGERQVKRFRTLRKASTSATSAARARCGSLVRRAPSDASIENKFGCFSIDCLELSDHGSNLDRGKCLPIIECPFCKLLFKNCKHNPICGTSADVETSFAAQRAVKRASASSTTTAPRLRLPFKITDHKWNENRSTFQHHIFR